MFSSLLVAFAMLPNTSAAPNVLGVGAELVSEHKVLLTSSSQFDMNRLADEADERESHNDVVSQSLTARLVLAQVAPRALSGSRSQTDRALRVVTESVRRVRSLEAERKLLRSAYNEKLSAIDKLSRQRASWRRDRKIATAKAAVQTLADRLTEASKRLSIARMQLHSAQTSLLRLVEGELAGTPTAARKKELGKLRTSLAKRLRPKVRKIILPDDSLDTLADPEELEEQAALIARAERQLRAEDRKLEARFTYYSRQRRLRDQSERATEIARRDGDSIRRTPGITNNARASGFSEAADDDGAVDGINNTPPEMPPENNSEPEPQVSSLESSSVVLADVVDEVTAKDLRRASRSSDPSTKARAAKRARDQLRKRLERLKKQRQKIEARAKALRSR